MIPWSGPGPHLHGAHTDKGKDCTRSWASLEGSTWLSEHARQKLRQSWFIIPWNKKSPRRKVLDQLIRGKATATGCQQTSRSLPCLRPASLCVVTVSSLVVPSWLLWHRESQVPPWHPHVPGSTQQRREGGGVSPSHMTVLTAGLQGGLEM